MRAVLGLLAACVVAGLVPAAEAGAQKSVLLQLRPRIGDTISMRLDQVMELAGKRVEMKATPPASMTTTTVTFSRAVIESGVTASTTIIAITDSMFVSSKDQAGKESPAVNQRQMQGQRVRLMIAPDGSTALSPENNSKAVTRAPSLIPATFPTTPVAVGDKWMREAALPSSTSQLGSTVAGWVQATFRLDSLTKGGDIAWISIKGKLMPDPAGSRPEGIASVDDGTVEGHMVLDRARGWLTESRFVIVAHSSLRQPFGVSGQPMKFEIRLVQELKTVK